MERKELLSRARNMLVELDGMNGAEILNILASIIVYFSEESGAETSLLVKSLGEAVDFIETHKAKTKKEETNKSFS